MNQNRLNKYTNYAFLVLALVFGYNLFINLNKQLWNDEIYSLVNFVFVPLKKTITDYHSTNNHIFFNLINALFLKSLGINSLKILLDHPYLIRIISLIYTAICCTYIYKSSILLLGKGKTIITLSILFTTLAFSNHALQVRGYSLSMMFSSIIFFYHLKYSIRSNYKTLIIILLLSALMIYSILSNLWFVLSAMCISLLQKKWRLAVAYLGGLFLSIAFYYPVIQYFTINQTLNSFDTNVHEIFWIYIPKLFYYFLAHRYILAIIIISAIYLLFKKYPKQIFIILIFFLLPFLFSFLKKQIPPDRIFLFFIPVIVVFTSYCVNYIISLSGKWQSFFIFIFILYLNLTYIFAILEVNNRLTSNIQQGIRKQNLMYNYYLCKYNPNEIVTFCKDKQLIVLFDTEPHDMIYYLEQNHIKSYNSNLADSLLKSDKIIYCISMFPEKAIDSLKLLLPDAKIEMESLDEGYYGILKCEQISNYAK